MRSNASRAGDWCVMLVTASSGWVGQGRNWPAPEDLRAHQRLRQNLGEASAPLQRFRARLELVSLRHVGSPCEF